MDSVQATGRLVGRSLAFADFEASTYVVNLLGKSWSAGDYARAARTLQTWARGVGAFFADYDALLTPTAPSAAFALGEASADPVAMYLNDIFTVTVNLAGLPAMSIPGGLDASGLPLGLQVIGRALDEGTVFSLGAALEKAAAFRAKPEKWW